MVTVYTSSGGPIRPKNVLKGNVWYICATNSVDGNHNKALSFTEYDAEVHFYPQFNFFL
jgi:hypothetical protein